ncbi:MAG: hypothetical protein INQ03_00280 [Candidatus Heimdallarchaeota archaeon]|nr:hypothetical protein [Candidatus Heimdallarchaeota archaeon]
MVVKDERKRYFLLEFLKTNPSVREINDQLRKIVLKLGGELFVARSGLHVFEFKGRVIVKTNHISRDIVEASITLLSFSNNLCTIETVSGTIKSLLSKIN